MERSANLSKKIGFDGFFDVFVKRPFSLLIFLNFYGAVG
jgi:hypothetical protein